MSGELVPFGKHKGEPVEQLLADQGYMEWLLAQPWVRDRYPTFHQTIINYGGEPSESPEHNQMQAAFLDDERCLALARLLLPPGLFDGARADAVFARSGDRKYLRKFLEHLRPLHVDPVIGKRQFEVGGWDLAFTLIPTTLHLETRSLPACPCVCDHERECPEVSPCRGGGDDEWRCRHRGHAADRGQGDRWQNLSHCDESCPWRDRDAGSWLRDDNGRWYQPAPRRLHVELKPDLGDDFPAALRQVLRYEGADVRCVVVRRHGFERVTWEQVQEMFAASGVSLVAEGLLER